MNHTERQIQAAERFHLRKGVRRSLASWARHCGYEPALHHQRLIEELEAVANGECKRLIINLPPGSAKSTYSSILFPAWFLCSRPDAAMIAASNTQDLAESFGRRIRNLIQQEHRVLGYRLSADSKAAGEWSTTMGGGYLAAGIGGTITGRRADLALIDDPVKGAEDADSDSYRNKQWEWYLMELKTRLKPGAPIILILTRWHEDDLAGRILAEEGEGWRVISIPMEAEENDPIGRSPGERLWPEYFTPEMVADAKKNPRVWSALYQQRPAPEEGDFFKREWLKPYAAEDLPADLVVYSASDHAVGLRDDASRTCLLSVGIDPAGTIWVLPDIFWKRADTEEVSNAMLAMMKRRKPLTWWAERGHISKSMGPFLRQRMREENTYVNLEEVTPAKDKKTRAQSIQGRMSMGCVRFPTFASWWSDAMAEMLGFPHGKHDDFVDTLAHIGMGIDRMAGSVVVKPRPDPPVLSKRWIKESAKRKQRYELALRENG